MDNMNVKTENTAPVGERKLQPGFSRLSVWAFSIGTSIGWGSLMVTCNTYLAQAGIIGTILGLVMGMLVILVITRNLQYLICRSPNAGGIYTFSREVCGYDFGFLASWFLFLTYLAVLCANITSVPLFVRYFFGDIFRFGFHYRIFGYDVYFGEALLSIIAICAVGLLLVNCRKAIHVIVIVGSLAFVIGFSLCTILAVINHAKSGFSYDPAFLPDTPSLAQVARIAVISPWAFIGFENVAHFSEEYSFKVTKIRRILVISVVMTTAVYLLVTLLSVTAYPPEYGSWLEYIRDMGNLSGLKAIPAFYAVYHYLGNTGVAILMAALVGAILTSLIGNTMALSRLLYAAGRDESAPKWLSKLNKHNNPTRAIIAIVVISSLVPFIGRTAIGWIVDVTTLNATIIYGLISYAVFMDARRRQIRYEQTTGIVGLALMIGFLLMVLLPNILSFSAMESESYVLFVLWAILGLIYFRKLVFKDRLNQYGRSVVVWIILLLLILFASLMWVTKQTQSVTANTFDEINQYYESAGITSAEEYLTSKGQEIQNANAMYTVASFAVFLFFATIILSNYQIMRKHDKEHLSELDKVEAKASTDHLTGVKNRRAYAYAQSVLDDRIAAGEVDSFAIVVCDINNLKVINDTQGHSAGDQCIRRSSDIICKVFKHSPVFRIGGDEFVVILENEDYRSRHEKIEELRRKSNECEAEIGSSIADGVADFVKGEDDTVLDVFSRADSLMYQRKAEIKSGKTR